MKSPLRQQNKNIGLAIYNQKDIIISEKVVNMIERILLELKFFMGFSLTSLWIAGLITLVSIMFD